jgi:hypothetical protein
VGIIIKNYAPNSAFKYLQLIVISLVFSCFIFAFQVNPAYSEGSRDMVKNGGDRPFTEWADDTTASVPRKTLLKVYAVSGETIYLGSSVYSSSDGHDIVVRSPSHVQTIYDVNNLTGAGFINTVAKETAGPKPLNAAGYTPFTVNVNETGFWEVEFHGPTATGNPVPVSATLQFATDSSTQSTVAAWDVTVVRSGAEKKGRVSADYLALNLGSNGRSLNSDFYVLTDDWYQYLTSMNGTDPFGFVFIANNRGYIDQTNGNTLYHSAKALENNLNFLGNILVQRPDVPDTATDITHRVFFNPPSSDLPGYQANGVAPPETTGFSFTAGPGGIGTTTIVGAGGDFSFNTSSSGSYQIVIDTYPLGSPDGVYDLSVDRTIENVSSVGLNTVSWDGKDAFGSNLPVGSYCAQIIQKGGEYHLPFLDVENNPNGFTIQVLNPPYTPAFPPDWKDTTVYYNDENYTTADSTAIDLDGLGATSPRSAVGGIDSASGVHAFTDYYGDVKGLETWTYFPGSWQETCFSIEEASVSGHVFYDTNDNGALNPGEPPLPNIQVTVTDGDGPHTVTTDTNGDYILFVKPGSVTAVVVAATVPAGYVLTTLGMDSQAFTATLGTHTPTNPVGYFLPPLEITIDPLTDCSESNTPVITGTTTAANGSVITLTINGVDYTTTANGGLWSVTVTNPLEWDKSYPFTVSVIDAYDRTASASGEVTICPMRYCCCDEDVIYTFHLTGFSLLAHCLMQPSSPVTITVDVPAGFDLTPTTNLTVPIKFYVLEESKWYFAQPTASIVGNQITFTLPYLPVTSESYTITQIIIGDRNQHILLDNPCAGGTFDFVIQVHTQCDNLIIHKPIIIADGPRTIEFISVNEQSILPVPEVTACTDATVTGRVYTCSGQPWVCDNVDVWFSDPCVGCSEDECGGPALTGTVRVQTDAFGDFTATLPAPPVSNTDYDAACGTGTTYKINAKPFVDPAIYCETEAFCTDVTVVPNTPAKLQWLVDTQDGPFVPVCSGVQMQKDQCQLVRVYLLDNCDVPNACSDHTGNIAPAEVDRIVYLSGIVSNEECTTDTAPPLVGAHFYATCPDLNYEGVTQINQVTIAQGSCYAEFFVVPIVDGYVKLTATSEFPNPAFNADSICAHIYNLTDPSDPVNLVGTTMVPDHDGTYPRGGWVYQEAIWLESELCPCAENMTVQVEFRHETTPLIDENTGEIIVGYGLTATWDTSFNATYNYTGRYDSGDTFSFGQFNTDNTCKSHFYIYPKAYSMCADPCGAVDECGKPVLSECTPACDWEGYMAVRVKVTCTTTGLTYASGWQEIRFASPVEDVRQLAADKWQIISTPKTLAGTGDLNFLLGTGNVKAAFYYNNGSWAAATGPLTPLYAYYVRTAQADCNIKNQDGYNAKYIFKRATLIGDTMPPSRPLAAGWNFVGVAAPPDGDGCATEEYLVYHWLGSACNLCKKVYNPGATTGNLALWNNLAVTADGGNILSWVDSLEPVLNGDGYWLWTSGTGSLAADTAPELLKQ